MTRDPAPVGLKALPYRIEKTGESVRLILPPRVRGSKALALALLYVVLAGGLALGIAFLAWRARPVVELLIWGILAVLALFRSAMVLVRAGHADIVITREELISFNRGREAGENQTVDLADIARLEMEVSSPRPWRLVARGPALSAELTTGKRIIIVANYPLEILDRLAADLRTFIEQARHRNPPGDTDDPEAGDLIPPAKIGIVDVSGIPEFQRNVLAQPPGSRIIMVRTGDSHTFYIRHWGFLGTIASLLCGIVVLLMLAAVPVCVATALLATNPLNRPPGTGWIIGICAGILALCAGAIIVAIHLYSRRTIIVASASPASGAGLVWSTRGILGARERHWTSGQLRAISTDRRSSAGNFRLSDTAHAVPLRLYVMDSFNRKFTLTDGEEFDIRWLATQLRSLLNMPPR